MSPLVVVLAVRGTISCSGAKLLMIPAAMKCIKTLFGRRRRTLVPTIGLKRRSTCWLLESLGWWRLMGAWCRQTLKAIVGAVWRGMRLAGLWGVLKNIAVSNISNGIWHFGVYILKHGQYMLHYRSIVAVVRIGAGLLVCWTGLRISFLFIKNCVSFAIPNQGISLFRHVV